MIGIAAWGMGCGDAPPVVVDGSEQSNQSDNAEQQDDPDQNNSDPQNTDQNNEQANNEDANQDNDGEVDDLPGHATLGDGDDELDAVDVTTIAQGWDDSVIGPRDLEFNPDADDQLWVVNHDTNSTTILFDPGTEEQSANNYAAPGHLHYQPNVSALAFNDYEEMATAQQTDEEPQQQTPDDFMGPTLWPTDLDIFDGGQASHLDMLHNSPLGSGIAWDEEIGVPQSDHETGGDIAFWYFDGYHGSLTHYDFVEDHGPGGTDHSAGVVHRYADGELEIEEGVVSHVAVDPQAELVYAADTGNNRLAVLDPHTGELGGAIHPNYDGSTQTYVHDAELSTFLDGDEEGWQTPAGLELHDGLLFVTDNATSTIYAYDLDGELIDRLDVSDEIEPGGLMGMTFDGENRLYLADAEGDAIVRIEGT